MKIYLISIFTFLLFVTLMEIQIPSIAAKDVNENFAKAAPKKPTTVIKPPAAPVATIIDKPVVILPSTDPTSNGGSTSGTTSGGSTSGTTSGTTSGGTTSGTTSGGTTSDTTSGGSTSTTTDGGNTPIAPVEPPKPKKPTKVVPVDG
jgi:hypothetical protein